MFNLIESPDSVVVTISELAQDNKLQFPVNAWEFARGSKIEQQIGAFGFNLQFTSFECSIGMKGVAKGFNEQLDGPNMDSI